MMNTTNIYNDNEDVNNPNHILVGVTNADVDDYQHHAGNVRLMNRIQETLLGYEAADHHGKQSIATTLVQEVFDVGGQFVQEEEGAARTLLFLTKLQAIQHVQNLFYASRTNENNVSGGGEQVDDVMSEDSNGFLIVNHDDDDNDDDDDRAAAATAATEEEEDRNAKKERPPVIITKAKSGSGGAAKGELLQRLSAMDGQNDDDNDEMMIVDSEDGVGEEVAACFLSILDSLEVQTTSNDKKNDDKETFDVDAMQTAFQSLVLSRNKMAKGASTRLEPSQHNKGLPQDIDIVMGEAGKSRKNNNVDISTLGVDLNQKEKYMLDKLDIVSRLVFKKGETGEKEYFGTTLHGLPHGQGFMLYTNKKKWVWGNWRRGKLHGPGGAIYENNHRCYGHFVKDQMHGRALYLTDESKYVGEYRKHRRDGYGILAHKTKGNFRGNFRQDRFEGRGIYKGINGATIKGEFVNWNCIQKDAW